MVKGDLGVESVERKDLASRTGVIPGVGLQDT
jgi:hypothetical protein